MDQTTNTNNFSENVDALFNDIQNFAKTDSVLGSPLTVGDKTLIPVISVTVGYGSTAMGGEKPHTNTIGTNGLGLGTRVTTNAVVVIDKNTVSMLPVNEKNNMQQIIDKLPQTISTVGETIKNVTQGNQQNSNQQK